MKNVLSNLTLSEVENFIKENKFPSFRAKQIYNGIHEGKKISEITTLPAELKQYLLEIFFDETLSILEIFESHDGTKKFIFKFNDEALVEGVLMEYKHGRTICVSTQVGCRMGCVFCESGKHGLIRNLEAGEILSQILVVNKLLNGKKDKREITNIVLMGSGEPLDNMDNVVKFLKLITDKDGLNFSQRNISLSTCGLVNQIDKLCELDLDINLTISLHASNDEIRKQIMKIANAYSLKELISSCKKYFNKTKRRIIFEYAMISNVNDNLKFADELSFLLKGMVCHVNLIPLNNNEKNQSNNNETNQSNNNERNQLNNNEKNQSNNNEKNQLNNNETNQLKSTSKKQIYAFCDRLTSKGISATVRRTMGDDIGGACGQLRAKFVGDKTPASSDKKGG